MKSGCPVRYRLRRLGSKNHLSVKYFSFPEWASVGASTKGAEGLKNLYNLYANPAISLSTKLSPLRMMAPI